MNRDPEAALATLFDSPDGYSFHGQIVHYPALVLIDPQGATFGAMHLLDPPD